MRSIVLAAALACAMPARAETIVAPPVAVPCMSWAEAQALFTKRHEVPVSRGQMTADTLMVITATPDGATWSLFGVSVSGTSCLLGWGEGYEPGQLAGDRRGSF